MMYLITGKNEKILRIRAVPVKQEKIKSPDFRGEYGVTWDCQVVPDGIMNRSNDKKLRDFILEQCEIDAVISLPLNTFFTTNKKTYILALTKKAPVMVDGVPTLQRQTSPVFTYLCSEIGETRDVYRFDIDQNDLQVASDLFNMFKGAKTSFANTLNMIGDRR